MDVKGIIDNIVQEMIELSKHEELTNGEVEEIIETINVEQNNWVTDSSGWKVFEALKNYVRIYKGAN